MIYSLTQSLITELSAFGCPIPVIYGPERPGQRALGTRIVIERDRSQVEGYKAPVSRPVNAKMVMARDVKVQIRVYSQSTVEGAMVHDHEALADAIANAVVSILHRIVQEAKQRVVWIDGRMLPASEIERDGLQTWPGVVYEIKLSVDDAVCEYKDWTDTLVARLGLDEATLGVTFTVPHPSESVGPSGVAPSAVMTDAGTLTFAEVGATGDTITRTVGSWVTDGFRTLQEVTIDGTSSNDGTGQITSVTPTVLTFDTYDLTAESIASAGVTITGG